MNAAARIALAPGHLVAAGSHRYKITTTALGVQVWQCVRCGARHLPTDPFTDCTAGPVKP